MHTKKHELLALREFVENHKKHDIHELRGKIQLKPDYAYKALRAIPALRLFPIETHTINP